MARLVNRLPKVVLGNEDSLAISQAQQLLVIIYYSGPEFLVDHLLQSPVCASLKIMLIYIIYAF